MTVYMLMFDFEDDGLEVIGVYSSRAAAEAAFDRFDPRGSAYIDERVLDADAFVRD